MRLALERLGVVQPQRTIVDALVDQIQLIEAEDALRDSLEEVDVLLHTYHSLESIHQAIKQCGVTQSIVQLYGENFSSMENDQTAGAEKEVDEKKQGVLKRIWEAIKRLIERFLKWVKSLFDPVAKLERQLLAAAKEVDKVKYPIEAHVLTVDQIETGRKDIMHVLTDLVTSGGWARTATFLAIVRNLKQFKDNKITINDKGELKAIILAHIDFCAKFSKLEKELNRKLDSFIKQNKTAKTPDQQITEEQMHIVLENAAMCGSAMDAIIESSRNIIAIFK